MQTSYSNTMAVAQAGQLADSGPKDVLSRNNPAVAVPFGVAVCESTGDDECKLPTTSAEASASIGVALRTQAIETSTSASSEYPTKSQVSVLRRGRVFVAVEQSVSKGDLAFVRYATGIADSTKTQKGAFRRNYDGTAQVATLTPTPVNSAQYRVEVDGRTYDYLADGSATAAEIVTGLTAAMTADADCSVNPSGSATLILTAKTPGKPFRVTADGNMAIAATTANAASAAPVTGAKFLSSAAAGGLAVLEVNLPQ